MRKILAALALTVLLTGCVDDRIKRQISLTNTRTQVAAKEFNEAATPEEKVKVADRYINGVPEREVPGMKHMTQVADDYFQGKDPKDPLNILKKKKPDE